MIITVEEICNFADGSFRSGQPLPEILVTESRSGSTADGVSLMENGKAWAFEFVEKFQPRTHRLLMDGGDFNIIYRRGSVTHYMTNVIMDVRGQAIEICRQRYGFNSSDDTFPAKAYAGKRALSLPEPIRMAYYHRIDGMGIPDSRALGPFNRILPYPVGRPWQSIDGYLGDLRLKKLLPVVEEMIPGIRPERKDLAYTNFMMFLNSWGSFVGEKKTDGDHLFVKNHIQDGVVYYVRDADVANMMILADPAEAIDRYCEHVLLRKEERFDFRPWAVPFEAPELPPPPSSSA
jgi:hypothetical protein